MPIADLVLRNARLADGEALFWLAITDGRISETGPEPDAPLARQTRSMDGVVLLPGFCDSHVHLFTGGISLGELNLSDVHSAQDLASAVRHHVAAHPGSDMICAYGANYDLMGAQRPDRQRLDAILPDRPIYITSTDFHCAWVNTSALRAADILTGVDPGANVVVGADGLASGELIEFEAMSLVRRLARSGGRESLGLTGEEPSGLTLQHWRDDLQCLRDAMDYCLSHGITAVTNMDGNLYQADLLEELADAGHLPIRVSLPMTITPGQSPERRAALIARAQSAPRGNLRFGRIKMFMDGVFDTWTAFRTDDYPGRPGDKGTPLFDPADFASVCIMADGAGLSIATHAVGDGAVRATLDGYEAAARANGLRDLRHRVEHIDMLHHADLPRFKALGVIASMQPVHPPGSSGLPLEPTVSIMSPARWADTFTWRALQDSGAVLAFGTDWPVSPLSPFNALASAMARCPWSDKVPDQRIPLAGCLSAYTKGGAFAEHAETERGQLVSGMHADLVVVDIAPDLANLTGRAPMPKVIMTIVGGQIVWTAKDTSDEQ
jgi:predicted amidohydrolase YtcJ